MVAEKAAQYTVLARRFRPQSFDEVVGQEHVGQAIRNAIRSNRVAHAYLFTGARGVGKTSTARIFAKALNCPNVQDGVPCNECEVCRGIGEGNDVDVLEIDGASNRGIDDIRQLRANVNVRSMRSPYKVYIIDEVHMLTKEAFNALLKTLEEPPPNVKFVFCTTEPNKVPDTILSRCQRFDFGTISQSSISARLQQIAEAEGKSVEADAIELVARRANGSMRDSQSLFDQLLAFGGETITTDDVHQLLGTAADDRLIDLVNALIERNQAGALQMIDEALLQGVQLGSFSDQLLAYFRDLLVTAAGAKTVGLSAVSESVRPQLQEQAERWGMHTVSAAMQILSETKSRMQRVNYGRALVELAIVRISMLEDLDALATIAKQVQNGAPVQAAAPSRQPAPRTSPAVKKKKKNAEVNPPSSATPSEAESVAGDSPASVRNEVAEAPTPRTNAAPPSTLELSESTLPQFWERFMRDLPEMLASHLKNSLRQAISGPNVLEIVFPSSYLFSKTYVERPEALKKLTDLATGITGSRVDFILSVDNTKSVPKPAPETPRKAPVERKSRSVLDKDEFVQNAVNIFGGQVVDVRTVYTSTSEGTSDA